MTRTTRLARRMLPALLTALLVALAIAPALAQEDGEEGRRESPQKFSPPDEMLQKAGLHVERAPVGALFGSPIGAAQGTQSAAVWSALGPTPINAEYWSGNTPAAGRVNSVVVDPRNGNVAYAAAAYGGVWKTLDGGATWVPLTDGLSTLSSGAVTLDALNPDVVWYGTGEQNFALDSYPGDGLFRSPDGGTTWVKMATTAQVGSYIARVLVNPASSSTIYVASERGVVRSTDGGTTWNATLAVDWCTDLVQNPSDPTKMIAGLLGGGIYRSTDGGGTWTALSSPALPTSGVFRVNLAISPTNPQVVMAGFGTNTNYTLLTLARTSDGGTTWRTLSGTPDYLGGQGFYDHVLAFDPADSSVGFAGGLFPYNTGNYGIVRTLNGGATWTDVTKGSTTWVHPDIHAFAFGPDGRFWVGCDGGVWRSSDRGASWTNLNATLSITQFYTLAVQPAGGGRLIGGTQDNGTVQYSGSAGWTQMAAGDGGPADFNKSNTSVYYATYVLMNPLYRGTVSSSSLTNITGPWTSDRADWANGGLVVDPNASLTILAGTYRVWRTTNEGLSWTAISGDLTGGGSRSDIRSIAVAAGQPNTVAASTNDGRVQVTNDLATWNLRTSGLPATSIPTVLINPADPLDMAVCAATGTGPRVLTSGNGGVSWTDVTGNLPGGEVPNCLGVDFRTVPRAMYVGTVDGVFASLDGGAHWSRTGTGIPASAVLGLGLDAPRDAMVAATHGRGMWRLALPTVPGPRAAGLSPPFERAGTTSLGLVVTGANFRPGATVQVDGAARPTTFVNAARLTATLAPGDVAAAGSHAVTVLGPDPYGYGSNALALPVLPPDSACCLFVDANVTRYAGTAGATGVVFADFDGDGIPDLALARFNANQVVILRGLADGTFTPWATLPVSGPRDLAAGDLDGNGYPDLVVAQPGANQVSMLYDGPGGFAGADSVSAGVAPTKVALGDLDNDGRLDVVVGQTGMYLVRLYNDGPGSGGATIAWRRFDLVRSPYASPVGVALADVDRDGYLDYLTGNLTNSTCQVITGTASFANRNYASGFAATAIATGYFNADSLPDFAVACGGDTVVVVFRNTGGGNFTRTVVPARPNPLALAAVDLDGDGATDLVMACAGSQTLTVLLGHGDGSFSAPLDFPLGRRPVALAVSRDARQIAVADSLGDLSVVRLDRGLKPMVFATGDQPVDAVAADLDGDLAPDLVTANGGGTLSLLFGDGDGTLAPRVELSAGGPVAALAVGDLDGDGKPDLIALRRDGTLLTWRNAGGRSFTPMTATPADSAGREMVLGDADGAGDALDLVITTPTAAHAWLHTGGFNFAPATALAAPPADPFHGARLRDLDGDGIPDLVVGADSSVSVHRGLGGGAFDPVGTVYPDGPGSRALALADVDGDGVPDLVYVSRAQASLTVRRGLGGLAFGAPARTPTGGGASHLVMADVTGDGRLDAVMADSVSGRLLVLAGTGQAPGTFAPFYAYHATRGAAVVALADFDRDGHLDAAVPGTQDALASVHLKLGPSGLLAVDDAARAPALMLSDIHPNPASGEQVVRFTIPRRGEVDLRVFDVQGRAVATLARGVLEAGEHTATWSGRGAGGTAAPGVYFVRLRAAGAQMTRRVARVR